MSITFLWPSLLPVVDQNAYFWTGPVNDGTRLISEVGTPTIASFHTFGTVRPGLLMYLMVGSDGYHQVTAIHRAGALAGVSISPTDPDGRTIVKMYGVARVCTDDEYAEGRETGHVACATAVGKVFASTDPNDSNIAVGDIIGAGDGYYDVLLRVVSNAGFEQRVFGRDISNTVNTMPASVVMNQTYSAGQAFRIAKAAFTVATSPTFAVVPAGGLSGGTNTGFVISSGLYTATQISNGVQLTLRNQLVSGCASAQHLHSGPTGGTPIRELGCKVEGNIMTVYSPEWNTRMLDTGVIVQVSAVGIFEE